MESHFIAGRGHNKRRDERGTTPVPLRRAIDVNAVCGIDPCDEMHALGSFWPNTRTSFESHLVKTFKACVPVEEHHPHIDALCMFYAELVAERLRGAKVDWVVRVLGSAEKEVEGSRPQGLLADMICGMLGARNVTDIFFRSDVRLPMRGVKRLSGPEALKARVQYVSQDLFIRPQELGGCALLLDDIFNTGASMRVYARAMKDFAKIEQVCAVNLAATRFSGGKDGHGMLKLALEGLLEHKSLGQVWVDANGIFHPRTDCPAIAEPSSCEVRFMAERSAKPCEECVPKERPKRKWWQVWG